MLIPVHSAIPFQGVIEFSQIRRRHLGEQFCPQVGGHMICEVLPVVFQSAEAESDRHLLQPLIQPLCESHPALFCQINPLIDIYVLAEFGGQFLLGISVDLGLDCFWV